MTTRIVDEKLKLQLGSREYSRRVRAANAAPVPSEQEVTSKHSHDEDDCLDCAVSELHMLRSTDTELKERVRELSQTLAQIIADCSDVEESGDLQKFYERMQQNASDARAVLAKGK